MIYLYSGVPGSGKSYHSVTDIMEFLVHKKLYVITNIPLDRKLITKKFKITLSELDKRLFIMENEDITVDFLKRFSVDNLERGKENQCLLVFDEAGDKFNTRNWEADDRMEWLKFYRVHRHFGYKVILVAQHDRYLDRQIRGCIQTEIEHRSFKYYKVFGFILYYLFGGLFQTISFNYPMKSSQGRKDSKIDASIMKLHKKYCKLYDTFNCLNDYLKEYEAAADADNGGCVVFNATGDPLAAPE